MELHVLDHPLVEHKLTVLRDKNTSSATFRELVTELVMLEAYEATRNLDIVDKPIETPVAPMVGKHIASPAPLIVPEDLTGRQCFLIDPMLATGGTLVTATHYLAERGAKDVTAINIIAAPEGIQYVQDHIDPSIAFKVVVCAVDEKLNEKAYIVPGLGDAGDRLYGVID